MSNTLVCTITTTEEVGSQAANSLSSNSPKVINDLANLLVGIASGSKFGTIDINVPTSTSVRGTATVTFTSVAAGACLAVNGVRFYAVSGTPVRANREFKRGVTDTADAADFVTTLAACTDAKVSGVVSGAAASGVVTLTSTAYGALANALKVEPLGIAAQGTVTLSSATGTITTTINGVNVTATAGASDTLSAVAVAAAINASTNALVKGFVSATSAAGVVTLYALQPGLRGNTVTLSSSAVGGSATSSVARLAGGAVAQWEGVQASGTVTLASGSDTMGATINGVSVSTAYDTSDTITATALAAAINSSTNALVRGLVTATSAAGVVTITAVRGGIGGNSVTLAATGTNATASGARLASGAVPTQFTFGGSSAPRYSSPGTNLGAGSGVALEFATSNSVTT